MKMIKKILLLPNTIRGYERSDPNRNGEYKFIRSFINDGMVIFDVGANVGDYTKYLLSHCNKINVHCFEPVKKTYDILNKNLSKELQKGKIQINNFALSNEDNETEMFIYDELDERNSLHFNKNHKFNSSIIHKEKVKLTTLNRYAAHNMINEIDFLKIDVEGHETKVIDGASELLKEGRINMIQFEYNNNWMAAGSTLETIFNNLNKFGYKFYRLAIWGKIPIRRFNKKLENYKHANYIAVLKK